MSFSDIFKKSFLEGYSTIELGTKGIIVALCFSLVLGLYIFFCYRLLTRRTFYSKNFNISLVCMSLITTAIILTIQSSVVVSLGMVGALSIVRFRTAIKEPMDLVFLYWAISVGIICGAGLSEIAIILSLVVTVAVFIAEYILRIWTAGYLYPEESYGTAVKRFLLSFDGVVDLLTILPAAFLSGFVAFRMLRVVRIFHLFRINTTYDSFNVIKAVLYDKRNQLAFSLFIILILMLAASLFMYGVEHDAQPDVFRNAFSGIWWSVSTLLTVGYGDIYPITPLGKGMAIVIAFLGVGTVAIPTGIISAGFVEQYTKLQSSSSSQEQISLHTVLIEIDSAWIGKTMDQIYAASSVRIIMIERDGKRIVPQPGTVIRLGDLVGLL